MMQHVMAGFRSGVIVGVITGIIKGLSMNLPVILGSIMVAGYSGILSGLIIGFSVGFFYSKRGYRLAQINLDVMYFSLCCALFFFGVIEVKMALDWLPSGISMISGVFWASTLVLFAVSYILYSFIKWVLHSMFLARLSFMLLNRWALYFSISMLAVSSIIWLIIPTLLDWQNQ